MGQILSIFALDSGETFNFESPQCDEKIEPLYNKLGGLLETGNSLLGQVENYENHSDLIRQAINLPNDREVQSRAFGAVVPHALLIKQFWQLSTQLGEAIGECIEALHSTEVRSSAEALAVQLARSLEFIVKFDMAKMMNPNLQNDFAFYRRAFGGQSRVYEGEIPLYDPETNIVSMYVAQSTPMLKGVTGALTARRLAAAVLDELAVVANTCAAMVLRKNGVRNEQEELLCQHAMTGAVLVFDHTDMRGAFCSRSRVSMKKCVKALRQGGESCVGLINCLKYSSKNFNNSTTPGHVVELFD